MKTIEFHFTFWPKGTQRSRKLIVGQGQALAQITLKCVCDVCDSRSDWAKRQGFELVEREGVLYAKIPHIDPDGPIVHSQMPDNLFTQGLCEGPLAYLGKSITYQGEIDDPFAYFIRCLYYGKGEGFYPSKR